MSGTGTFTDLAYRADAEGYYDLAIDAANGDLETTDGLESAFMVSLFSDRRARVDEVADPMKRRGWIGDLVAEAFGDVHGSGVWLYEQRRLTGEVVVGLRLEAEASLLWMIAEDLVRTVTGQILANPAERSVTLVIDVTEPQGGSTRRAYVLADATRKGAIVRI
jgi:phage gp46-like protein